MNKGDARVILLNIKIAGEPIQQGFADDIELTINPQNTRNCVQKSLLGETIDWDSAKQKYVAYLSQEDTFKLIAGNNSYQVRVKKGMDVISSAIKYMKFGCVNSTEVLEDPEVQNDT